MIAHASRQLQKREKNFTAFFVEMAAIVLAMENFDTYSRGRTFTVYSDHKPLQAQEKDTKQIARSLF